jgi:hypothetical protein
MTYPVPGYPVTALDSWSNERLLKLLQSYKFMILFFELCSGPILRTTECEEVSKPGGWRRASVICLLIDRRRNG